jgi:hypothetical protein
MVKRATCHDCGTKEGQLHILGCRHGALPFLRQSTDLLPVRLQKAEDRRFARRMGLSHGLTDAQQKDWEKLLGDKGRIPFVLYPNLCAKCGTLWPEMFLVPDAEWKHYIEPQMQREMLCKACYKQVKAADKQSGPHLAQAARRNQPLQGLPLGSWPCRGPGFRPTPAPVRHEAPSASRLARAPLRWADLARSARGRARFGGARSPLPLGA